MVALHIVVLRGHRQLQLISNARDLLGSYGGSKIIVVLTQLSSVKLKDSAFKSLILLDFHKLMMASTLKTFRISCGQIQKARKSEQKDWNKSDVAAWVS